MGNARTRCGCPDSPVSWRGSIVLRLSGCNSGWCIGVDSLRSSPMWGSDECLSDPVEAHVAVLIHCVNDVCGYRASTPRNPFRSGRFDAWGVRTHAAMRPQCAARSRAIRMPTLLLDRYSLPTSRQSWGRAGSAACHDGSHRKAWAMACRTVSCEQVPQDTVTDTTQGERSVGMCRSAAAGDAGVDVELAGAHQPGGGRIGEIERP